MCVFASGRSSIVSEQIWVMATSTWVTLSATRTLCSCALPQQMPEHVLSFPFAVTSCCNKEFAHAHKYHFALAAVTVLLPV
jgi:hypothetical protein